jgi:hypothetical protein
MLPWVVPGLMLLWGEPGLKLLLVERVYSYESVSE